MNGNSTSLETFTQKNEEDIFKLLESNSLGLSTEEAKKRIAEFGSNSLNAKKEYHQILKLLSFFKSPLIIILIVAAIISSVIGEITEAAIIFCMVILSMLLDYFEEHSAHSAAEKLKQTVKNKVSVLRLGIETELFAEQLCIGDIILLNAGKVVPADVRIITAKDFFVNQSSLTGESFPAEKVASVLKAVPSAIDEMHNIAFMGSSVVTGTANAIVVKTGMQTRFGKIAAELGEQESETNFSKGVKGFGMLIMWVTVILVLFIFLINALLKHNYFESFMFAVAVAVGLTPELLPMVMSVTMARGSIKMAKQGAIVKRLSAIPDFGSMDILCTDKTGTLTQDKIQLIKYTDIEGNVSEKVLLYAYLNSFFQTGIKNPLDEALLNFKHFSVDEYKKIDEIPFDFVRKKMSVVVSQGEQTTIVTKGAPEEIFKSCPFFHEVGQQEKALEQYHDLSAEGFRVLAIASKAVAHKNTPYSKTDESELEFLGFISFLDPPKEGVDATIAALQNIGIEIKIITGDNDLVAQKVCHEIGLSVKRIMLGREMDTLTDDALRIRVQETTIFARFSPEQKNRIINSLRSSNHVVGYMGDGINDAPSLQTADVGISVSNATDVAKEAADIILTEKNLLILKDAVLEGRKTFGNTIKYIQMGLSSNFGNMLSVAVATIFLPFLPMLPIQILLNNFLYDFSQVTIPSDNVDESYVLTPKKWNINFIRRFMFVFGLISSVFDMITFFIFFKLMNVSQAQFQTAWFMESLATQTLVIHFIRTGKIPFFQSNAGWAIYLSTFLCMAIGWIIPFTSLGVLFGMQKPSMRMILIISGLVIAYLLLVEISKRAFYKRYNF
jgi:P-type Mg2+ transporter